MLWARQRAAKHTTSQIAPATMAPIMRAPAGIARRPDDQAMRRFIGYFVLPVWLAGGFLDYVWHRRTKIETTTGVSESLMHTLMMVEAGPAVFWAVFLEVNAGVIAIIVGAAGARGDGYLGCVLYGSPAHDSASGATYS